MLSQQRVNPAFVFLRLIATLLLVVGITTLGTNNAYANTGDTQLGGTISFLQYGLTITVTAVTSTNGTCYDTTHCVYFSYTTTGSLPDSQYRVIVDGYNPDGTDAGVFCAWAGAPCYVPTLYAGVTYNRFRILADTASGRIVEGTFFVGSPPAIVDPGPPINAPTGNCILSDGQLVELARGAGWSETDIPTAVAIALAESAGKVNAVYRNPSPISYDLGLWQVNDVAHPSYDRNSLVTNPLFNANAGKEIKAATGFASWATYTNGKYQSFESRANLAFHNNLGSIHLSSCSGAATNNTTTGTGGTATPTDNCGFSFNPLDYLKCLFFPGAGTFNQWTAFQNNVTTKPPYSVIIPAYTYVNDIVNGVGACVSSSQQTSCSGHAPQSVTLPGQTSAYSFDPLSAASRSARDNSGYGYILTVIKIFLWIGFATFVMYRISKTLGAKETA